MNDIMQDPAVFMPVYPGVPMHFQSELTTTANAPVPLPAQAPKVVVLQSEQYITALFPGVGRLARVVLFNDAFPLLSIPEYACVPSSLYTRSRSPLP